MLQRENVTCYLDNILCAPLTLEVHSLSWLVQFSSCWSLFGLVRIPWLGCLIWRAWSHRFNSTVQIQARSTLKWQLSLKVMSWCSSVTTLEKFEFEMLSSSLLFCHWRNDWNVIACCCLFFLHLAHFLTVLSALPRFQFFLCFFTIRPLLLHEESWNGRMQPVNVIVP